MQYRIRVGAVVYTTRDGWHTSRQVPEFSVMAGSPMDAAKIAADIMLCAAEKEGNPKAYFGMLDEDGNWAGDERSAVADVSAFEDRP